MQFVPRFITQPRSTGALYLMIAAMLGIISWLDYFTGYELSFFLFYFLPISLAAWHRGAREASFVAIVATAGWYLSNRLSGQQHSSHFITVWNTGMRLVAFLILAFIVARIGREMKKLRTLLPICGLCKKVRNDAGYWEQVDDYFRQRDQTQFSHGMCPECSERFYKPKTLLVGSKAEDVLIVKDALVRANLPHILYSAAELNTAEQWLAGTGTCSDRTMHPVPDIIIVDTDAAPEDCFAFIRSVQGQRQFKDVPVLCLGSLEEPAAIKTAYEAGATAIFTKAGGCQELADFLRTSRA